MKKKIFFQHPLLLIILFYFNTTLYAQTDSSNTSGNGADVDLLSLSIEELMNVKVVSASKKEERIIDAPSNITVISSQTIKEWGSRDIKDVLKRVTGYQVIADRDEWVFAARGNVSDNNQKYLILIDGQRMNSIENFGPGNIIEIPNNLSNVKQIEIIKGPGSAVWGSDALAGVINIITYNIDDLKGDKKTSASVTYGSGNHIVGDFQVGQKVADNASLLLMGSFSQSDGRDITQSQSSGFPVVSQTYTDGTPATYNTRLDKHKFGYMLQAKANVGKININAINFVTDVYNRHFEYGTGRENYLSTNKTAVEANYKNTFFDKLDFTYRLATFYNSAEYRPEKQGTTSTVLPSNLAWRDKGMFTQAEINAPLIEELLKISAGIDYRYTVCGPNQRINGINPGAPTSTTVSGTIKDTLLPGSKYSLAGNGFWIDKYLEDHQLGGYTMFNFSPAKWITVTAGTRIDFNKQRGSDNLNINPRGAVIVYPFKDAAFKTIYNRGYLRPANFQASSQNVGSEVMNQVDIIWMHKVGKINYSLTGYWQELKGFINILPGFGFANTGDYNSKGVELEVSARLSNSVFVWGNATYADPEGTNFNSTLAYDNRRVDLNGKLLTYSGTSSSIGTTLRFLKGKIYISPAARYLSSATYRVKAAASAEKDVADNYSKTPDFLYFDMNIGFEPNKRFNFSLYVDNMFNEKRQAPLSIWNGSVGQFGRFLSLRARINI